MQQQDFRVLLTDHSRAGPNVAITPAEQGRIN
jgi:hypothetical protein